MGDMEGVYDEYGGLLPTCPSLILAQTDRMSTVSERFRASGTDISATQVVVFVVIAW